MVYDLKRYELFGWDYEFHSPLTDAEVNWFARYAEKAAGPALALACGSGRLLVKLAERGFEVHGLDLCPAMLDLARERVDKADPKVRSRIHLHRGDMTDFDLGRQFPLVFIADNSFRELKTRDQLLACLHCIHRHLQPQGTFLLVERRFEPHRFPNGRREFCWSDPITNPKTGETIRRRGELQYHAGTKTMTGTFFYKITQPDGTETSEECTFDAPILFKEDYLDLFTAAGFTARITVNYEDRADDGQSPYLCFLCRKKG